MAGAREGQWPEEGMRSCIHSFPYKAFKRAAVGSRWAGNMGCSVTAA